MVDQARFVTIKRASEIFGIPVWKLQRAAKAGDLKTYTFFNSRRLVLVAELTDKIVASLNGGEK
jgi:hypothetical protein